MNQQVILLHGLAESPLTMAGLEVSLKAARYKVANLFMPWPHDGKISVARTQLRNMADHIVLPTTHDLTASDPRAIFQIP